jgi:hypothetical protein
MSDRKVTVVVTRWPGTRTPFEVGEEHCLDYLSALVATAHPVDSFTYECMGWTYTKVSTQDTAQWRLR